MNNEKTNVIAGLINGAAWDRTLNWILETNSNMSLADINEDSTGWGNYGNSKFNFTGKYSTDFGKNFTDTTASTEKPENNSYLLGTGVTEYTKKNNIYDFAGNCWEWTTESYSSGNPVLRGGDYNDDGSEIPAYLRLNNSPDLSISRFSFRSSLYVNL